MELQDRYESFESLDAEILAISVDRLDQAGYVVDRLGVTFPILYDPEAEVVRRYGVYDLLGDKVAAPSVFVIDKEGSIRWRYIGRSIIDRPTVTHIVERLEAIAGG